MNYKINITEEAENEILKAKDWYEEQQSGLGESFSATIKEHINQLKNPKVEHKVVFKNVRRVLTRRFPFVIYYTRDEKKLIVKILAVLHNRREQLKFDLPFISHSSGSSDGPLSQFWYDLYCLLLEKSCIFIASFCL